MADYVAPSATGIVPVALQTDHTAGLSAFGWRRMIANRIRRTIRALWHATVAKSKRAHNCAPSRMSRRKPQVIV